jgi:hypothetical protein
VYAFPSDIDILLYHVAAVAQTTMHESRDDRRTHAHVGIEHGIARLRQRQYQSLD